MQAHIRAQIHTWRQKQQRNTAQRQLAGTGEYCGWYQGPKLMWSSRSSPDTGRSLNPWSQSLVTAERWLQREPKPISKAAQRHMLWRVHETAPSPECFHSEWLTLQPAPTSKYSRGFLIPGSLSLPQLWSFMHFPDMFLKYCNFALFLPGILTLSIEPALLRLGLTCWWRLTGH